MIAEDKRSRFIRSVLSSFAALVFALGISSIIIIFSGGNPLTALKVIIEGSFGSGTNILLTLQKTIPLIFTGLSVAICFQAGLFNIGAEGQLYTGAIISAWLAVALPDGHGIVLIPVVIIVSSLGGALWGLVPGLLRSRRGVHEVLTTIMMNYVAIHLTLFLVKGPLRGDPHIVKSANLPDSMRLPSLSRIGPLSISIGIVIAVLVAIVVWIFLFKTKWGYLLRMAGKNPAAVNYAGFSWKKIITYTMCLGGFLAGLGGAVEIMGLHHTFYGQFSPGYGFDGIAVALIAANHPLAVIFVAVLFGALRAADRSLQLVDGVPNNLILIIQGLVILFVGTRIYIEKRVLSLKIPGMKKPEK